MKTWELRKQYRALRDAINKEVGRRDSCRETLDYKRERLEYHKQNAVRFEKTIEVLNTACELRRQELRERIDNLVTKGLRAVFDRPDYEFSFTMTIKGARLGATPMLRSDYKDSHIWTSVREGHGGGVADVVSFLLRVIVLTMTRPKVAPVLILDESFRHVSPDRLGGVAVLLKELTSSAGVQFLLVTHKPELLDAADTIYSATLDENMTTQIKLEYDLRDEIYHREPRKGEVGLDRSTYFDHENFTKREDGEVVWPDDSPWEGKVSRVVTHKRGTRAAKKEARKRRKYKKKRRRIKKRK